MERSNYKIEFNQITLPPISEIKDKLVSFDGIYSIFEKMAEYLVQYFNLSKDEIKRCIIHSAYNWQERYNSTFELYNEALIQERLVLADQMKIEVLTTFSQFLMSSDDYDQLSRIAEKSLLFYMKEYS